MEFKSQGFIVLCKKPEKDGEYFISQYDDCPTPDVLEAQILITEDEVKSFINTLDKPKNYIYKPVEIKYSIKDIELS